MVAGAEACLPAHTFSVIQPAAESTTQATGTLSSASLHLSSLTRALALPATSRLELRGLAVTGAALPTAPYPLPPASFLALSAIRLLLPAAAANATALSGPRLSLRDVAITTPSCAALSLHQDFACRASPSPNFTVTPTSLLVHRFTTPVADLTNVSLRCSGAAAPFPCLAASVSSGAQLLATISAMQDAVRSGLPLTLTPVPAFVHVATSFALVPPPTDQEASGSSSGSSSSGSSPGVLQPVEVVIPRLVIGGGSGSNVTSNSSATLQPSSTAAAALPELDLAGSQGLLVLRPGAGVVLQDLVLRRPPPGPDSGLPGALLRLPLWTFAFSRGLLGWSEIPVLQLARGVVIRDLPRSELAMHLIDTATFDGTKAEVAASNLPPALRPWQLAWSSGVFWDRRAQLVPGTPGDVWVEWFSSKSSIMTLRGVRLQPETWLCRGGGGGGSNSGDGSSATLVAAADAWATAPPPDAECLRREPLWAVEPARPGVGASSSNGTSGSNSNSSYSRLVLPLLTTQREFHEQSGVKPRDLDAGNRGFSEYTGYFLLSPVAPLAVWPRPFGFAVAAEYPGYEVVRNRAVLVGAPYAVRVLDVRQLIGAVRLPAAAALEERAAAAVAAGGPQLAAATVASVSLTVRSLVLANLPSASGCVAGQREGCEAQFARRVVAETAAAARRALLQGDLVTAGGHKRAALLATADPAAGSTTQGMPAALANFTSCLWTFDFDRRAAWQQLAAPAGGSSGNSSLLAASLRPAGLPYVYLDSVTLLLPAAELQLLAALWRSTVDRATVSTATAALGGDFAEHLAAALAASSAPVSGSPASPALLTFDRFVWCGLEGRNVTLTSDVDPAWGISIGGNDSSSLLFMPLEAALPGPLLQLTATPAPPPMPGSAGSSGAPDTRPRSAPPSVPGSLPVGGPPGCGTAGGGGGSGCGSEGGGGGDISGGLGSITSMEDSRATPVAVVAGAAAAGAVAALAAAGAFVWFKRRRQHTPKPSAVPVPCPPGKGSLNLTHQLSAGRESGLSGGSSDGDGGAGSAGAVGIVIAASSSGSQPLAQSLLLFSVGSLVSGAGGASVASPAGGWPLSVSGSSGEAGAAAASTAIASGSSPSPLGSKARQLQQQQQQLLQQQQQQLQQQRMLISAGSMAAAIDNALSGSCSDIDVELAAAPASADSVPEDDEEKEAAMTGHGAAGATAPAAAISAAAAAPVPTSPGASGPRLAAKKTAQGCGSGSASASASGGSSGHCAAPAAAGAAGAQVGSAAAAAAAAAAGSGSSGGGRDAGGGGSSSRPGTPQLGTAGAGATFLNAAALRLRAALWAAPAAGGGAGKGSSSFARPASTPSLPALAMSPKATPIASPVAGRPPRPPPFAARGLQSPVLKGHQGPVSPTAASGASWRAAGGRVASMLTLRFKGNGVGVGGGGGALFGTGTAPGALLSPPPPPSDVGQVPAGAAGAAAAVSAAYPGAHAASTASARARSAIVPALPGVALAPIRTAATAAAHRTASLSSLPLAAADVIASPPTSSRGRGALARALAGIHRDMQAMQAAVAAGAAVGAVAGAGAGAAGAAEGPAGGGLVEEVVDAGYWQFSVGSSVGPASASTTRDTQILAEAAAAAAAGLPSEAAAAAVAAAVAAALTSPTGAPRAAAAARRGSTLKRASVSASRAASAAAAAGGVSSTDTAGKPTSDGSKPAAGSGSLLEHQHSDGPTAAVLATNSNPVLRTAESHGSRVVCGPAAPMAGVAITRELGRGAQGVVYAGTWRGLNVAVKSQLLHRSCIQPQQQGVAAAAAVAAGTGAAASGAAAGLDPRIAQAVQEAAISAAVSHPNVVATYTYSLQQLGAGGGVGASVGTDGALKAAACGAAARRSSGSAPFASFFSNGSSGAASCEGEVWKLTLVQELCDANSLRHCLVTGRLARARAVRVQQAPPSAGFARSLGGGTSCSAAALEWAPLLIPINRAASSTNQQPAPRLGTGSGAHMLPPRAASAISPLHPFVIGSCGVGSESRSTGDGSCRYNNSNNGDKPETADSNAKGGGAGTRASDPNGRATGDGGQSSGADSQPLEAPALLSIEVALSVAMQVARGLAHLHERSIVHADVSSANVLLQTTTSCANPALHGASGTSAGQTGSASGGARAGTYLAAGTKDVAPATHAMSRALAFHTPAADAHTPRFPDHGPGSAGPRTASGSGSALSEAGPDPYSYGYVAKVCDFGLSGRLDADAGATHLSGPARRSSAYSAPELVRSGRAGPAGDVYALAVVLWELAWGAPLPALLVRPEGAGVREWLSRQDLLDPATAEALPPSLLSWPSHVPPGYVALVGECLAAAPAERPLMRAVHARLREMLVVTNNGR
ncbi:hypothetical protein HYH02_004310 [Chlamydomonas schloesseri]|uniref:Protein kinase domain-containing protein n=1 Tax=Chlamydomonas schloesseri TaxID=2026947 RepID=A0A836B8N5_9CHLO|nr:hypothetical protein HYH02_004310 [Chlamydomonas schloesseri]|eukprot:KAG2451041.1 hypothetical protein HYH02_004310 [Chlamydomonas schloesseri]